MNPQLKKGVLELCVLSQLTKEDKYGYELTDAISREMSIAAGTLSRFLCLTVRQQNVFLAAASSSIG